MLYGLTSENVAEFFRLHPEFTEYEFITNVGSCSHSTNLTAMDD